MIEYALLTGFIVSIITTLIATPRIMKNAKEKNFIGRDVHKTKRVFIPELGGLSILLGFAIGLFSFIGYTTFTGMGIELVPILAALSCIFITAIIGLMDDIFWIKWRTKILLPLLAAIPLMAVMAGESTMALPIIGVVELGLIYTLVVIPLGVTGGANALNMIGGYNGLEAGLGALMTATLFVIALLSGSIPAAILLACMLGALLGFLVYNWYPAKTFMGDTGTLQIGAAIAVAVIIGNMEKYGLILMSLYFINLIIFSWGIMTKAKLIRFASPDKNGKLKAPKTFWKHYLPFLIIKYTNPTEQRLVYYLLGLQALVCIGTLAIYFGGF